MRFTEYQKVVSYCKFYVIWTPKYRRKVLVEEIADSLRESITETCAANHINLIEMKISPDHVNLTLMVDPHMGIHKAICRIKSESASLRKAYPTLASRLPSLWNSYYMVTTQKPSARQIMGFLEDQKAH